MPATYAHILITEGSLVEFRSRSEIASQLRGNVLTHSHFLYLGCAGPDYPYLDLLQPGQKAWADHMHYDHTGDITQSMAKQLLILSRGGIDREEFLIPFCWTLGYISHVTADLVIHPVILNVVGPYEENSTEHRHCEMIQDAYIYNKIRNGAEIKHNDLMRIVQNCSDPTDKDKIHPFLKTFWQDALKIHFGQDFNANAPHIDEWHDQFEDWLTFAGRPLFIGRIIDPNHKFTYKETAEITDEEREKFIKNLPLPDGSRKEYDVPFKKAISDVGDKWLLLATGLLSNNLARFLPTAKNGDLDTGKELASNEFILWG